MPAPINLLPGPSITGQRLQGVEAASTGGRPTPGPRSTIKKAACPRQADAICKARRKGQA